MSVTNIKWSEESQTLGRLFGGIVGSGGVALAIWLLVVGPRIAADANIEGPWAVLAIMSFVVPAFLGGLGMLAASRDTPLTPRFVAATLISAALLCMAAYMRHSSIVADAGALEQREDQMRAMFESGQYKQSTEYQQWAARCKKEGTMDACGAQSFNVSTTEK